MWKHSHIPGGFIAIGIVVLASCLALTERPNYLDTWGDGSDDSTSRDTDGTSDTGSDGGCIPTELPSELSCFDGLDNDCDGYPDALDTDCGATCQGSGSLTGEVNGESVELDAIGWTDLGDTDGNGYNEVYVLGFDTGGAYKGCDRINAIANGSDPFTDGWFTEWPNLEGALTAGDSVSFGPTSGSNTSEFLAGKWVNGSEFPDGFINVLHGTATLDEYSKTTYELTMSDLSVSEGSDSLSGSFTACLCANLDMALLAP